MLQDKNMEDKFLDEASEVLRVFQPKMVQIWRQLGFPKVKQVERLNTAISHHKELWESMLEEEQNNKKKIVGSIDRLGRQYHQLCRELGTHFREFDSDAPLLEMEKALQDALAELNQEKEERMKVVRTLFEEEDNLRKRLEMEQFLLNRERIPTSEQLSQLQQHLIFLRKEVISRQEDYVTLRDATRDIMQQLEQSTCSSIEMNLLMTEPEHASLSNEALMKVKELHQSFSAELERNKKKAKELRSSIEALCIRLDIEPFTHQLFCGHTPTAITALEQELSRLEELKRQNMERFINSVRQELLACWDQCFISQTQRASFLPFKEDIFTEDLLELHEEEVKKYQNLFNENKEIFVKVNYREGLWKKMEDIEARGRDPTRLFGNRGCALLQEEKERKKIMKELPRVEAQLSELFSQYLEKTGQPLLINGDDYRYIIEQQWKSHDDQKENEKLQRQRERAEKLEAEAKGGAQPTTPMKRRLGTTAMRTAMESPKAKQRKLAAPSPRPGRRILTEALVNGLPGGTASEAHDQSTVSTYSAFTEALTRKARQDHCRSSTVLESPLPNKSMMDHPSTLPRRRSPRLTACLTPTTPVSASRSLFRRSRTAPLMPPPCTSTSTLHLRSPARVTPSRSTSKLTLSKNPRPFLV